MIAKNRVRKIEADRKIEAERKAKEQELLEAKRLEKSEITITAAKEGPAPAGALTTGMMTSMGGTAAEVIDKKIITLCEEVTAITNEGKMRELQRQELLLAMNIARNKKEEAIKLITRIKNVIEEAATVPIENKILMNDLLKQMKKDLKAMIITLDAIITTGTIAAPAAGEGIPATAAQRKAKALEEMKATKKEKAAKKIGTKIKNIAAQRKAEALVKLKEEALKQKAVEKQMIIKIDHQKAEVARRARELEVIRELRFSPEETLELLKSQKNIQKKEKEISEKLQENERKSSKTSSNFSIMERTIKEIDILQIQKDERIAAIQRAMPKEQRLTPEEERIAEIQRVEEQEMLEAIADVKTLEEAEKYFKNSEEEAKDKLMLSDEQIEKLEKKLKIAGEYLKLVKAKTARDEVIETAAVVIKQRAEAREYLENTKMEAVKLVKDAKKYLKDTKKEANLSLLITDKKQKEKLEKKLKIAEEYLKLIKAVVAGDTVIETGSEEQKIAKGMVKQIISDEQIEKLEKKLKIAEEYLKLVEIKADKMEEAILEEQGMLKAIADVDQMKAIEEQSMNNSGNEGLTRNQNIGRDVDIFSSVKNKQILEISDIVEDFLSDYLSIGMVPRFISELNTKYFGYHEEKRKYQTPEEVFKEFNIKIQQRKTKAASKIAEIYRNRKEERIVKLKRTQNLKERQTAAVENERKAATEAERKAISTITKYINNKTIRKALEQKAKEEADLKAVADRLEAERKAKAEADLQAARLEAERTAISTIIKYINNKTIKPALKKIKAAVKRKAAGETAAEIEANNGPPGGGDPDGKGGPGNDDGPPGGSNNGHNPPGGGDNNGNGSPGNDGPPGGSNNGHNPPGGGDNNGNGNGEIEQKAAAERKTELKAKLEKIKEEKKIEADRLEADRKIEAERVEAELKEEADRLEVERKAKTEADLQAEIEAIRQKLQELRSKAIEEAIEQEPLEKEKKELFYVPPKADRDIKEEILELKAKLKAVVREEDKDRIKEVIKELQEEAGIITAEQITAEYQRESYPQKAKQQEDIKEEILSLEEILKMNLPENGKKAIEAELKELQEEAGIITAEQITAEYQRESYPQKEKILEDIKEEILSLEEILKMNLPEKERLEAEAKLKKRQEEAGIITAEQITAEYQRESYPQKEKILEDIKEEILSLEEILKMNLPEKERLEAEAKLKKRQEEAGIITAEQITAEYQRESYPQKEKILEDIKEEILSLEEILKMNLPEKERLEAEAKLKKRQ